MVNGLDRFKAHFAGYQDRYVLIGGTASSLAMEELGVEFRVTKDLDIVLCVEALDRAFAEAFWAFIKAGDYENRQKSTGKRLFYRFYAPKQAGYPEMLELFARVPDALDLKEDAELTPVPVDEEVSSLSAILMDDDYYAFVMARRVVIHDLAVIKADALIPLKARAFVDLTERKARGEPVDSKNIRKHKNDIIRLFAILEREQIIVLPETVRIDLKKALDLIAPEVIDLKSLGIPRMQLSEVLNELARIFDLGNTREADPPAAP